MTNLFETGQLFQVIEPRVYRVRDAAVLVEWLLECGYISERELGLRAPAEVLVDVFGQQGLDLAFGLEEVPAGRSAVVLPQESEAA